MNVSLTPMLEQFVRDLTMTGEFNNASEVVREALRLLKRNEEERQAKLVRLRAAIQEGLDAVERGDYHELETEKDWDEFFDGL